MKKQKRNTSIIIPLVIIAVIAIVAFLNSGSPGSSSETNYEISEILNDALQDEYHAEAVYEKVIEDFGEVRPYTNIVRAERRHSQAIERLYENYNLPIPENEWANVDKVPSFNSIEEACQASAQAEIDNIELYDEFLPSVKENDIKTVFTNNRDASKNNHLPAFTRCS